MAEIASNTYDDMLSEEWIALKADLLLLCKQHSSASDSMFETLLDNLLKHYINGGDLKGGVQLRAAVRASAVNELEQAKHMISTLKEDRRQQTVLLQQLLDETKQLKAALANRESALADNREIHLKEILSYKNDILKLKIQIEQTTNSDGVQPHVYDRRAMQRVQAELLQLRKENARYQAQAEEFSKAQQTAAKLKEAEEQIVALKVLMDETRADDALRRSRASQHSAEPIHREKSNVYVQTDNVPGTKFINDTESLQNHWERRVRRMHDEYQDQMTKRDSDIIFIARAALQSKQDFLNFVVSKEQMAVTTLAIENQKLLAHSDSIFSITEMIEVSQWVDEQLSSLAKCNTLPATLGNFDEMIQKLTQDFSEAVKSFRTKEIAYETTSSFLIDQIEQDHQEIQYLRQAIEEFERKVFSLEHDNRRLQTLISQYEGYVLEQPSAVSAFIQQLQDSEMALLKDRYEESFALSKDGTANKMSSEFCRYLESNLLDPIKDRLSSMASDSTRLLIKRQLCTKISLLLTLINRNDLDKSFQTRVQQMYDNETHSRDSASDKILEEFAGSVGNFISGAEVFLDELADILTQIELKHRSCTVSSVKKTDSGSQNLNIIAGEDTLPQQLKALRQDFLAQPRYVKPEAPIDGFKAGTPLLVARQLYVGNASFGEVMPSPKSVVSSTQGTGPPATPRLYRLSPRFSALKSSRNRAEFVRDSILDQARRLEHKIAMADNT